MHGPKLKTLHKAFDPSYHTIFDVKKAWCDEVSGKDPSKVDLHDADGKVGDGILGQLGFDVDAKFTIFYSCLGGGGGGRANKYIGGGQRRYKCNHKGCQAAFMSAGALAAHKKRV